MGSVGRDPAVGIVAALLVAVQRAEVVGVRAARDLRAGPGLVAQLISPGGLRLATAAAAAPLALAARGSPLVIGPGEPALDVGMLPGVDHTPRSIREAGFVVPRLAGVTAVRVVGALGARRMVPIVVLVELHHVFVDGAGRNPIALDLHPEAVVGAPGDIESGCFPHAVSVPHSPTSGECEPIGVGRDNASCALVAVAREP